MQKSRLKLLNPRKWMRTVSSSTRILLAGVGACILALSLVGRAQSTDDEAWQQFLTWLKVAPPANGPLEVLQGYQKNLAAKGLAQPDVAREMGAVLRLMRNRIDAWPLMFDKIYASATPSFDTKPNALLIDAIQGRSPGRALDIGMGQGRNAIALAAKGWIVTGFDVSAEGLAVAKAQAARAGASITVVQDSVDQFDLGTNQWDLIAVIYGPGVIADRIYAARLHRSLKPGGIVVVESFASDRSDAQRRPVDIDPGELRRAFSGFRILKFEDAQGVSDWDPQTTRLVRLVAEKKRE